MYEMHWNELPMPGGSSIEEKRPMTTFFLTIRQGPHFQTLFFGQKHKGAKFEGVGWVQVCAV